MTAARLGSQGWPLHEWALVLLVVSVVSYVVWSRVDVVLEQAEMQRFAMQLDNFRTGMRLHLADQLLKNRLQVEDIAASNPVSWLVKPPPGYVDAGGAREGGSWSFDGAHRQLRYVPVRAGGMEPVQADIRIMVYLPEEPTLSTADKAFKIQLCPTQAFTWSGRVFAGGASCTRSSRPQQSQQE